MNAAIAKPLRSWGLTVGAIGLLECAALLLVGAEAFFRGYLVSKKGLRPHQQQRRTRDQAYGSYREARRA